MKYLILAALLCTSFFSSASETGMVKIKNIEAYISGAITVITNKQDVNPANCASSIKYISAKENVSTILSLLLTAKVSEREVRIFLDNKNCYSGYPIIERVVF